MDSAILARRLGSRALLIWADPGESGLDSGAPIGIYADNLELAEYVWEHFYRDYDTIRGRGIETGPPVPARFVEVSGGRTFEALGSLRSHAMVASSGRETQWRN